MLAQLKADCDLRWRVKGPLDAQTRVASRSSGQSKDENTTGGRLILGQFRARPEHLINSCSSSLVLLMIISNGPYLIAAALA
jgi:hypothetical protein